ncbi:MAG: endonuclease/exonuclease/phosphatase family protein [Candidatus Omnitrophota bacterium]|nr:endonuclease/exonuclease/phosphatase family protein [Candidatus Omnitrophota bacterium]
MTAKRKLNNIVFLLVLTFIFYVQYAFAGIVEPSHANQIRLGTFNIEKLGKANEYQSKNAAEILKNYDIVAIQEVMNTGASKTDPLGNVGIEALKKIVFYLGDDWDYVISREPNGTANAEKSKALNTFEYYAFIFRKSKIDLITDSANLWDEVKNSMQDLKDQERQFDREPFIASFKVRNGNLDFTLITIHAAAPAAKWRKDEIKRLAIVYKTVQDLDPNQNDIFLMGDFNTNVDKKEWDDLKGLLGMKHLLTSSDVTTLNKPKGRLSNSQYDTIWYQVEYSGEDIIPESAQVHQAWKEDLSFQQDIKIPRILKGDNRQIWLYGKYASDHLPVMVLLWPDRDTDNFRSNIYLEKSELDQGLIYNEEALSQKLKGKGKEEVAEVLGEPAVKKPSGGNKKILEYWWYKLPEAGIFVYFKDSRVVRISVLTEDRRGKKL